MKNKLTGLLCLFTAVFTSLALSSLAYAGDGAFNITKGQVNALHNDVVNNTPADSGIVAVLLQATEADATLEDYDNAADLFAANTEANFTGYNRKVLTDVDLVATIVNDTTNTQSADAPNLVWTSAGGAVDNSLVKIIFFYDPDTTGGTDADLLPLAHMDFVVTTNGNNLTANLAAAGYFTAD